MMISEEVYAVESNLTTTLQPTLTVLLPSFSGEDGDEHALTEEWCFFDEINNSKPSDAFIFDPSPEEEPVIVAVSVDIILNHQIILPLLLVTAIRST